MSNKLYETAMKESGNLRETFPGLTQEQAERVSLYFAIGYLDPTPTPDEIEEAQSWQDQRWTEEEPTRNVPDEDNTGMDIEEVVAEAQKKGAQIFRYVLLIDGYTFTGEALLAYKFEEEWESMINRPELTRAEYGVRSRDDARFAYTWHTL